MRSEGMSACVSMCYEGLITILIVVHTLASIDTESALAPFSYCCGSVRFKILTFSSLPPLSPLLSSPWFLSSFLSMTLLG